MSVPPELLKQQMGGPKPPMGAEPPTESAAPPGGPVTTPQPQEGAKQEGMVKISMATKILTQALSVFGPLSKEGKIINQALGILIKGFGAEANQSDDLIPAEMQSLVRSLPGAGGGSPVQKAVGAMPPTQQPVQGA